MQTLTNDFALAYATVLTKIFNQWMHDEDSGCDYDAVGQRQVMNFGSIMAIFQPKGAGEGWIEEAALIFTLSKEGKAAGHKLNEAAFKRFGPIIETVNNKLYESWTTFLGPRQNKWMELMDKPEYSTIQDFVNALCGITKPIAFEKGVIKFSFEIKFWYMETNIHYWNAVELMKWIEASPAYPAYMATLRAAKEKRLREDYGYSEEQITEYFGSWLSGAEPTYVEEDREEYVLSRGTVCVIPTIKDQDQANLSGVKRKRSDDDEPEQKPTKKSRA
jgi:hypothetical protein